LAEQPERVVDDYVSDVRFERTFILVVVRLLKVSAQVSFKGALNGALFGLYVKYVWFLRLVWVMWCCWLVCRRIGGGCV
jgi:hypothetical protein